VAQGKLQQNDEQTSAQHTGVSKRQKKRERATAKQEKNRLKKENAPRNEDTWNTNEKQNPMFEKYYKVWSNSVSYMLI
jgi:hypothetical protein